MYMKCHFVEIFCFTLAALNTVAAQSTHSNLSDGDRAYDRVQYNAAEKHYRTAADREVGNPKAIYNLGNTLYQEGRFEDAARRFQQVARMNQTPALKADALHNLGDALLKQQKYKESVQAYEESLRLRPADPGTKQNLQMAIKRLREDEKKEQQQKNQQQQSQDQNRSPQQKPQNQADQQKDQPNQPRQNQQGPPQKPPGEQQKKMEEQRLKMEDAKRLLETAVSADDRKNARKYRSVNPQMKPKSSKKDW